MIYFFPGDNFQSSIYLLLACSIILRELSHIQEGSMRTMSHLSPWRVSRALNKARYHGTRYSGSTTCKFAAWQSLKMSWRRPPFVSSQQFHKSEKWGRFAWIIHFELLPNLY